MGDNIENSELNDNNNGVLRELNNNQLLIASLQQKNKRGQVTSHIIFQLLL